MPAPLLVEPLLVLLIDECGVLSYVPVKTDLAYPIASAQCSTGSHYS